MVKPQVNKIKVLTVAAKTSLKQGSMSQDAEASSTASCMGGTRSGEGRHVTRLLPFFLNGMRKKLHLLVLCLCVSPCAAELLLHVFGVLHSPTNLTQFIKVNGVKDLSLKRELNGTKKLLVKIRNGVMVENHDNRFELGNNGTTLVISNLTRNDLGPYIIDYTYLNNTPVDKRINLALSGDQKEDAQTNPTEKGVTPRQETEETNQWIYIPIIICVIMVLVLFVIYICRMKSSNTTRQDNKGERVQTKKEENMPMAPKNKQEHEENLRNFEEMDDQKERMQTNQNENGLLGHKNKELEDEENLRTPFKETESGINEIHPQCFKMYSGKDIKLHPDPSDKNSVPSDSSVKLSESQVIEIPPDSLDKLSASKVTDTHPDSSVIAFHLPSILYSKIPKRHDNSKACPAM